jgi:predicted permease
MGNLTLAKEQSRDMWSFLSLEQFSQDVRYALRTFRRSAGFTSVAVLSLALGIAGATAIFSMIDALLIRPLPFPESDRLVRITELYPKAILDYFRQRSHTLTIALVGPASELNLTGDGPALRIACSETSANFFAVLGVKAERGRTFGSDEDVPGKDAVVVVSHQLWKSRFHEDPDIIGRSIELAGIRRRVVGIAPASFSFPSTRVQAWVPARMDPGQPDDYWGGAFVPLIARLRPGARLQDAQAEIHLLAAGVWKLFPWPMPRYWNADTKVISLQSDLAGPSENKLFVLLGAVLVLLLIACVNVASLLLARATTRRKEIAMRAALGAGEGRIMRQLLTESIVLALSAGIAGVVLGTFSSSLFRSIVPPDISAPTQSSLDWRVTSFAALLSILTGVGFGIIPALSARSLDLVEAMKTGSQRSVKGVWVRFRGWLIGVEIALTMMLLIAAGLLMKSLYDLTTANPGFNAKRILTLKISPNESFCTQRQSCIEFYNRLLQRVRNVPGVVDAAAVNSVPINGDLPAFPTDVQDHPRTAEFPSPVLWAGAITPDYLRLMQIPLLAGRRFNEGDGPDASPVILISASTARRFWPGESPLGKHIKRSSETRWRTIVGVVGDVQQVSLAGHPVDWLAGALYMPYAQAAAADGRIPGVMNLVVKTSGRADQIAVEVRRIAVDADPNIPVGKVQELTGIVEGSISGFRSTMWVFLAFASVALGLAAIGLYGLMSYAVSQRTYEISVRMAIGAQRSAVVALILNQALRITVAGIAAGIVGAVLLTRFLSGLLFRVTATDPLTFVGVSIVLLLVSAAAGSIPAWRAARINPIRTLRAE